MSTSLTTIRTRFLLTTAAFLLINASIVRADGAGWGVNGKWDGDGDGDSDGNGSRGCYWRGDDDCDEEGDGNDENDADENSALGAGATASYNNTARIVTVHAVLASLVWVFLIPTGGILIRLGLKSPWILRIHALLQSLSYLIFIVAVGLGIYLVRNLSFPGLNLWDDPHTKLGIAILVLAFFQPFLGLVHHAMYKRRATAAKAGKTTKLPGRTPPGYTHLWLGRTLIVLGMINGGLGLRLASQSPYYTNGRAKAIAYGVGAGVMFLLNESSK